MHNVPGGRETATHGWTERFREGNSAPCPAPPAASHLHLQHSLVSAFSLRTWDFLFNENTKEDKNIKIYSEKSHIHQMFLK